MHGFLATKGFNIECLGSSCNMEPIRQYNHLLNKFPDDQIMLDTDQVICFLDGYIYNKNLIQEKMKADWKTSFSYYIESDTEECLKILRGGFCGYHYNRQTQTVIIYTDQLSVKALYYYVDGEKWIVSNSFSFIVEVLKANGCVYALNETAVQYMLTYGYMLDDSTFIKEIHRLMPGHYAVINQKDIKINRYYVIDNTEERMSEQEAVERIDKAFRTAIQREFDKDLEYGYRHLVDLSRGLDSRMVSWVAHDMGYTNQLNVTYSRAKYKDDIISKDIACYLRHEYIFKVLDDAKWLFDIDEITAKNNGAALYSGITGGDRLLAIIQGGNFGIEHTGMIGDAILSTFYKDKEFNFQMPGFGMHRYSERLSYTFDDKVLSNYTNQEIFAIYSRGILGAQSSYMIRQNYFETASAFTDVDFLNTIFSVPFEYRVKHHIYLKWMLEKYPKSTEFGWEKWGGIKPKESCIFFRKIRTTQRLSKQIVCNLLKIGNNDSMNPLDYWYQHDKDIQRYFFEYYTENIDRMSSMEHLKKDTADMFLKGNVTEKTMALTVLAMVKKIIS